MVDFVVSLFQSSVQVSMIDIVYPHNHPVHCILTCLYFFDVLFTQIPRPCTPEDTRRNNAFHEKKSLFHIGIFVAKNVFMLVKSLPSFVQTIVELNVVISYHGDLFAECFKTFITTGSSDSFSRLVRNHIVRKILCRGPGTFICFCVQSIFSHHCDPNTKHLLEFFRRLCKKPNIVCKSQNRQPQSLIMKTQAPLMADFQKRSSKISMLATKIARAIGSP